MKKITKMDVAFYGAWLLSLAFLYYAMVNA